MNVRFEPGLSFEPQLGEMTEKAQGLLRAARCRLQRAVVAISDYSTRKPATAMGLALGMGVLVGWLVKRR